MFGRKEGGPPWRRRKGTKTFELLAPGRKRLSVQPFPSIWLSLETFDSIFLLEPSNFQLFFMFEFEKEGATLLPPRKCLQELGRLPEGMVDFRSIGRSCPQAGVAQNQLREVATSKANANAVTNNDASTDFDNQHLLYLMDEHLSSLSFLSSFLCHPPPLLLHLLLPLLLPLLFLLFPLPLPLLVPPISALYTSLGPLSSADLPPGTSHSQCLSRQLKMRPTAQCQRCYKQQQTTNQRTNLTAGTCYIQWMSICPSSAPLSNKALDFNMRQMLSLSILLSSM